MPRRHHFNAKVYETKKPEESKSIFTDGTWINSCNQVLFANWLKAAFNTMFGFKDELQKIFLSFVSQSQCLRKQKQIYIAVRCEEGFNNMQKEKKSVHHICPQTVPIPARHQALEKLNERKWDKRCITARNSPFEEQVPKRSIASWKRGRYSHDQN